MSRTYIARDPAAWVRRYEPGRGDAIVIAPDGRAHELRNVVEGYKMVVEDAMHAYDSFVLVRGQWEPYSLRKPLTEAGLRGLEQAIAVGALELQP